MRRLFPYINGTVRHARYHQRPLHVRFQYQKVMCTLYPREAMAAPFKDRNHITDFIEDLISFLNGLHDRIHELEPNHEIHRDPVSIVDVLKILPRTNCKKCGHATCMAFAVALRQGKALPENCPDFPEPVNTYSVYPVLGRDGTVESTFAMESGNQEFPFSSIGRASKNETLRK